MGIVTEIKDFDNTSRFRQYFKTPHQSATLTASPKGEAKPSVAFATSPPTEESPQGEAESKKNFFYSQRRRKIGVFNLF